MASRDDSKLISIASGCLNEEGNLQEFYDRVVAVMAHFPRYDYEIIMADNHSTDGSREILRRLAASDRRFKVILNSRDFGPVRSGYNAFLRAAGDAVVLMASDLQDPPELIADFIEKWEEGYPVVIAKRTDSKERGPLAWSRRVYYDLLDRLSEGEDVIKDFTGFGLYDRSFMDALKLYKDPDPYFRGFVSDIGLKRAEVEFAQPERKHGRSKHGIFSLYSIAMNGFVNHSMLPLRIATFTGFCLAGLSLLAALLYLVYKLLFWNTFNAGLAPLILGVFFFASLQLMFLGILGEYVGAVLVQVKARPLVIEEEIINFEDPAAATVPEN